ncbi:retinol dehydrogenase 13-like isoform X2 [Ixodes scapularis]
MDLLAERIREPPELDYCPAEGLGSKLEPKLLDAVTGRHHDGSPGGLVVSLLLLLWPVSFLLATLCLICVVCKVYSRLTLGRCFSNADMSGRTVLITGANAAERIREPPELDYCPAEGLGSKLEPKLLDAVTGRHHDGSPGGLVVSLLLLLWPVSFLLATLCLICVVCKVYSRLTLGRCFSNADMSGRTVLITGANAGIGKETAKELARRNARVILACRDTSRAAAAAREIYRETGREVVLRRLDLCSFKSIREFADDIIAGEERLDVLINNAGIVQETQLPIVMIQECDFLSIRFGVRRLM